MTAKNSRNAQVSRPEPNRGQEDILEAVKREIFRISGALGELKPLTARDRGRLAAKGLDATAKILVLSNGYLPTLCKIIKRGLTLSELQLITDEGEAELRYAFRKRIIQNGVQFTREEANRKKWVNITFLQKIEENAVDAVDLNGEQMLVPMRYVNKRSKPRRFEQLSGPLPELITFQGSMLDDVGKDVFIESIIKDHAVAIELLKANLNMHRFMKSIADSDQGSEIASNFAQFFQRTSLNTVHYAHRYDAIRAKAIFKRLKEFAQLAETTAQPFLEFSAMLADPEARKQVLNEYDRVQSEIQTRIDWLESQETTDHDELRLFLYDMLTSGVKK